MKTRIRSDESASALITAMGIVVVLSVCVGGAMLYTRAVARNVERTVTMQRATEVANGALELAFSQWRAICRAKPTQALASDSFDPAIPLPTAANFPDIANFTASRTSGTATLSNFKVIAVDPQLVPGAALTTPPVPADGRSPGQKVFNYLASADVTLPSRGFPMTVKVRRVFQKVTSSPWNFAIFYNDPLEIHPGPSFKVTGWVHTNSSLYTGHDSLEFASGATYSNDWTIGFKPGDSAHTNETPSSPVYPANLPPSQKSAQQPFGFDPASSLNAKDNNPNNDSYREYLQKANPAFSDPFVDPATNTSVRFYDQAGARVLVDALNNVVIKNAADVTVTASSSGADKALYDTISKAISTNSSIQDNREGTAVRLVNVDIDVITKAVADKTLNGFNGILYVSDTSAGQTGGSPKRGVRLRNGASLPLGGLTVATDNPVYIQGDYNTGATATSQPPSNSGDPTKPTVANYTRQMSAVMADAVTILSNNWTDANSSNPLASRVATNTTVNTAILAGIVPTTTGDYSGGAENYPRFLEKWDSVSFTYYGSMVQLFTSAQAIGKWGKSNVYGAPLRRWYFDTNLYTSAPPGTFSLINYNKERWFQQ